MWLAARDLPFSRSQIRRRIDEGEVRLNGAPARAAQKLRVGDRLRFVPPPPSAPRDLPEAIPLTVLFEDAHLIVIDKPPGLVVHPATSHASGTLVNALLHHVGEEGRAELTAAFSAASSAAFSIGGERRPGIVHRLDKDTSGVMVVAKDEPTLVGLQEQFQSHSLDRRYLALVEGVVAEEGTFRTRYGRHPRERKRFSSRVAGGKLAITHWRVIERLTGATLVEVRLETGRTHQIRVHFADHAHPVLGDQTYGRTPRDPRLRAVADALGRQALHAAVLGFVHPISGARIECSTEPPLDMRQTIATLRGPASGSTRTP